MQKYIVSSLELHLFFGRIMKEHSLFLQASFVQKDEEFIKAAAYYRTEFENLLCEVVEMSDGIVRSKVLNSGEIVTEYTRSTEMRTTNLTGIPIDTKITILEENLSSGDCLLVTPELFNNVKNINRAALKLVDGLIQLKEEILDRVLSCYMFTSNYPLLIKHILREANLYRVYIIALEDGQDIDRKNMQYTELFWNQIMMEHALFIRGLLDPTENKLIDASDEFAKDYENLLLEAQDMTDETMKSITKETIKKTEEFRDFKVAGTKGIDACEIQSIILPLLADHVLREANHYLRILNS
mgnify:CR=1 FL=1